MTNEDFFRGDEIDKVEMFEKVKEIMIDFLRGYPLHIYWGIIEGRFEGNLGEKVRKRLVEDKIIEYVGFDSNKKPIYRLTPKGVEFAVSFRNLNYGRETARYSRETYKFNKRIIFLTIGLFIIGAFQLTLIYLQNPLF